MKVSLSRFLALGVATVVLCFIAVQSIDAQSNNEKPAQPKYNVYAQPDIDGDMQTYRRLDYVVVTPNGPDDGGDFGPHTPGSQTSGLQEAFDHAKKIKRDLYICGGGQYRLEKTLHIPWRHSFRCDGGEYNIFYTQKEGNAVHIDSQMNVFLKLGSVIAPYSNGCAVLMKPETIGPDGFAVITASRFEFNYLIAGGDPWGLVDGAGHQDVGVSLFLDGSPGCITNNRIFAFEVSGSTKGLYLRKDVFNNLIEIDFMHLCRTLIQIGDEEFPGVGFNRIETVVMDGDTLGERVGARIFGHSNILTMNLVNASDDQGVIFESTARDNLIFALYLAGGVTNNALVANNRIISTHSQGLGVATPAVAPSGQEVENRYAWPVQIIITDPGHVTEWRLAELSHAENWVYNPLREDVQPMNEQTHTAIRPKTVTNSPRAFHQRLKSSADSKEESVTIKGPLFAGQCITLDPGDRIQLTYSQAPSWRWKALR